MKPHRMLSLGDGRRKRGGGAHDHHHGSFWIGHHRGGLWALISSLIIPIAKMEYFSCEKCQLLQIFSYQSLSSGLRKPEYQAREMSGQGKGLSLNGFEIHRTNSHIRCACSAMLTVVALKKEATRPVGLLLAWLAGLAGWLGS